MDIFLEILQSIFPSLIILIVVYLLMSGFMDNEDKRRNFLLRKEKHKESMPVRFQAYERLALFMERISPNSLLLRVKAGDLTNGEYLRLLQTQIRQEYEHNLSQQIYVPSEVWDHIVTAKSAMVSMLNTVSAEVGPKGSGRQLAEALLKHELEMGTIPTKIALMKIRSVVSTEF